MPRFPSAQGRLNHEPDSTLAVTKTCPKDGVHLCLTPAPDAVKPEVRYPLFTDVWVQSSRMTHVWKCGSPQTTLIVLELLECILHLLGSVKLLEPECPRGRFR